MRQRRAAVMAIGDELVLGQRLDTNSQWISARLVERGVLVVEHVTIGDDADEIARALRRLSERVGVIVSTGGLGPTRDDLTRQALAHAMGEELVEDEQALGQIRAFFESRGRAMPEANRVQAYRPVSARVIPNEVGTAPGLAAQVGGARVWCLPGPPSEMRPMFDREVPGSISTDTEIATAQVQTIGWGESRVGEAIEDLMARGGEAVVGTTASRGIVAVRVRAIGEGCRDRVQELVREIRNRLGPIVFAVGDVSLQQACLDLLRQRRQRLCTVESCTGGMLGEMITQVPGSSAAYLGGWVTYANEMKMREVGVPEGVLADEGAVSSACARAMALGAVRRSGADWALSITGIAGPGGGSEAKPVGTVWIGRASHDGACQTRRFRFRGGREDIRAWSAISALAMLRLGLLGEEMDLLFEEERRDS